MNGVLYPSLSDKQESIFIHEGIPLCNQLKIDFENVVIIANGKEVSSDYTPKALDIIMIRKLPSDPVTITVAIIAVAVVAGTTAGVVMYNQQKQMQEEMEKMKKASSNPTIDNRPFIAGASNSPATGQGQPYVMGRHLFTPYLLQSGFYELSGTDGQDQFYYAALECGFNSQVIKSMNVEDIRVKTWSDTTPQNGVYDFDYSIFRDGGRVEIRQGAQFTELTNLNKKIISDTYQNEIPYADEIASGDKAYLDYTLDRNAKSVSVSITFPNGLYAYNDDNDRINGSRSIIPRYSIDGGNSWTDFTFNQNGTQSNNFNRNELSELRYIASRNFSTAELTAVKNSDTPIIIRVYSTNNTNDKQRTSCAVLYIQSVCYDPNYSDFRDCKIIEDRELELSTIIGIKIKATETNQSKFTKINIITQSVARTWNGTAWSNTKSQTRNPAAIALEVLTSEAHQASKYALDEIDLDALGEWYEYCEGKNYYFDYVSNQKQSKQALLEKILKAGDALLYFDLYGSLSVAIDTYKENAVACFNAQNIIDIENKKSFTRQIDGARITFINSENDIFVEDSELVMRDGLEYTAESILQEIKLEGITTHEHIVKYARRLMATLNLRPKTTIVTVGQEGVYYSPFSKILLQDDSLKIGLSNGVIDTIYGENNLIIAIKTNDLVQFEEGKNYGLTIQHPTENGAEVINVRVSGTGRTGEIIFDDDVDIGTIDTGDLFSFGELNASGNFERITSPFLIVSSSRVGNQFKLDLVDYNEAIYETGPIPPYTSNITQPYKQTPAELPPDYVTNEQLNEALKQGGTTPIEAPDTPVVSAAAEESGIRCYATINTEGIRNSVKTVKWRIQREGKETVTAETQTLDYFYQFNRTTDGYPETDDLQLYKVFAQVINNYDKTSAESEGKIPNTDTYGTWIVPTPIISKSEVDRTITLKIGISQGSKTVYGNVRSLIEIRKGSEAWQTPNLTANHLPTEESTNIDNYKGGENPVYVSQTFVQSLPLDGQKVPTPESPDLPVLSNTTYQYRITTGNEAGNADPVEITATALCTSVVDFVYANQDYKELAVGSLAAIIGILGHVTGSAMGGGNNFISLATFIQDGIKYYSGDVRLGGKTQYFRIEPIDTSLPEDDWEYSISLRGSNINIDGGQTSFDEFLEVFNDASQTYKTRIESEKISFQIKLDGEWIEYGEIGGTNSAVINDDIISENMALSTSAVYGKMTDCILKAGLNIKLTVTDNNIRVHKGSQCVLGTLSGVRAVVGSDIDINFSTPNKIWYLLYDTSSSVAYIESWNTKALERPPDFSLDTEYIYFDTANRKLYARIPTAYVEIPHWTLPFAQVTVGGHGKIEDVQIFDYLSIIGQCKFLIDKTVFIAPNGRNEDGSLKNEIGQGLLTYSSIGGTDEPLYIELYLPDYPVPRGLKGYSYNRIDNTRSTDFNSILCYIGQQIFSEGKVVGVKLKRPFQQPDLQDGLVTDNATYSSKLIEEKLAERDDSISLLRTDVNNVYTYVSGLRDYSRDETNTWKLFQVGSKNYFVYRKVFLSFSTSATTILDLGSNDYTVISVEGMFAKKRTGLAGYFWHQLDFQPYTTQAEAVTTALASRVEENGGNGLILYVSDEDRNNGNGGYRVTVEYIKERFF